jgi:uncharacterized membrane protein
MNYSDYRRVARENLAGNWGLSVGVSFVAAILGALMTSPASFDFKIDSGLFESLPTSFYGLFMILGSITATISLAQFILGGTVQLGYTQYLLKQYHRQPLAFNDLFSQFDRFGQGFLQAFLRNLYIFLWSLLFVIPGIVKSYSYAMTPFIMAENPEMSAQEAITASRELMDGHKGELFTLELTFLGWAILSVLTLGIGALFLTPYEHAARAAFYKDLTSQKVNVA